MGEAVPDELNDYVPRISLKLGSESKSSRIPTMFGNNQSCKLMTKKTEEFSH